MIKVENDASGHRKRLKDRWLNVGDEGFSDYEMLELLLSFSIPRKDTKALSKLLLRRFGNLYNVLKSTPDQLKNVHGMGENSSILLNLCGSLSDLEKPKILGSKIQSAYDLTDYFHREIGFKEEEYFYIVLLNQKNKVISVEQIEHGIENRAQIYLKKIVRSCLDYFATGVICIHNHPSGTEEFSNSDIELTKKIHTVLKSVEVRLLDHLLITQTESISMLEKGIYSFNN
jgi:DNA repair protein RadC